MSMRVLLSTTNILICEYVAYKKDRITDNCHGKHRWLYKDLRRYLLCSPIACSMASRNFCGTRIGRIGAVLFDSLLSIEFELI